MSSITKIILFTDADGRARFREEAIEFTEGTPDMELSREFPCESYQLRHSPVGFDFTFHCVTRPAWVLILQGQMEIILRDGSSRLFKPGDCLYAADVLPDGATFDEKVHGHWSHQVGPDPLVTLFVR